MEGASFRHLLVRPSPIAAQDSPYKEGAMVLVFPAYSQVASSHLPKIPTVLITPKTAGAILLQLQYIGLVNVDSLRISYERYQYAQVINV